MSAAIIAKPVQEALARALRIDWNQADSLLREGSQVVLMREFLRRTALWANALGCPGEWPFFSIADQIASCSATVKSALSSPDLAGIEQRFEHLSFYPKRILYSFVKWNAVKDLEEVRSCQLPDPYEPMVLVFERGGIFRVENRMFQFGVACFPFGSVKILLSKPPVTDLDAASLARWDAEWKLELERNRRK